MKVVVQTSEKTLTKNIEEFEYGSTIARIKLTYPGEEISPLRYELFRYRIPGGVVVIYKDNRVLRTRNEWYERLAISELAKSYNSDINLNVTVKKDNYITEIDGSFGDTMIEVKRATIHQEWIDFYRKKLKKIGYKRAIIIGAEVDRPISIPPNMTVYKFIVDWDAVSRFYNKYEFPAWFSHLLPRRHIRFLLPNGKWKGMKRSLSKTAKHTPDSKLKQALSWLKYHLPVKIYYSLAQMVNPPRDYHGRGYPFSTKVTAVFDIDADKHICSIGSSGICSTCMREATRKKLEVHKLLSGIKHRFVFSGKKGFHCYLLDDDFKVIETDICKITEYTTLLKDYSDNITFVDSNSQFDLHRIIKLPDTVDLSTGMTVSGSPVKIKMQNRLESVWR